MDETTHDASDGHSPAPGPLCIREPEDLLGFIPHMIGEWPQESLVAVTVGAGTVGVTVRVDLPPPGRDTDLGAYAAAVCEYLLTDLIAEGAVLVVYTSEPWTVVSSPPRLELVGQLQDALVEAGLPLLDAWLVGDRHWRSLLCDRSSCCPWPGKPLETIAASRLGAELVYRGSTYETPFLDEAREADVARTGTVLPSDAAAEALLGRLRDDSHSWWQPSVFAAALAAWDETLSSPRDPGDDRLGLLAATLARPAIRDAVMVSACMGGAAAWRGSVALGVLERPQSEHEKHERGQPGRQDLTDDDVPAWRAGTETVSGDIWAVAGPVPELPGGLAADAVEGRLAEWAGADGPQGDGVDAGLTEDARALSAENAALEFGAVLLGSTQGAPDWSRIARLERVARRLTELEDPEVRAPALALLGWICWARGRGAKASGYLRRALSVRPGYRFARLFARMIEGGELAGWARRPETAWRRLDDVA